MKLLCLGTGAADWNPKAASADPAFRRLTAALVNDDLMIDSTSATPEQIAEAIVENAGIFEKKPFEKTKILLSPFVILPTKEFGTDDGESISIALKNGLHYATSGHAKLAALQAGGANFVEAVLTDSNENVCAIDIQAYEANAGFVYESKL